jgi:hypothetical protein
MKPEITTEDIERAANGFEHTAELIKLGLSEAAIKSAERHAALLRSILEVMKN